MKIFALASILSPLIGFLILLLGWRFSEKVISTATRISLIVVLSSTLALIVLFVKNGFAPQSVFLTHLYEHTENSFPISLLVDTYSLVYLFLTAVLANVTAKYSRYYLHREEGYRRYFTLILLLVTGSNLVALSGTLDLLVAGWELLGFSSFLLIGFYWWRRQPANNSTIALTVYRVCDFGLLVGTILTHFCWEGGVRFAALPASTVDPLLLLALSGLLLFGSLGKSAQFPFINWLPRALEGPTPSSAIFYGALSIHAGVFLLIRIAPIWSQFEMIRLTIGLIGLISAVIGTVTARTLSNIKAQIAYAAIAQVGLMFMELALGLYWLALLHLVLHSFLRAYQILISPSVIAHALRVIGSSFQAEPPTITKHLLRFPIGMSSTFDKAIYRLTLADFYLQPARIRWFYTVLKPSVAGLVALVGVIAFGQWKHWQWQGDLRNYVSALACVLMLLSSLHSLTTKQTASLAWVKVGIALLLGFITISTLDPVETLSIASVHFVLGVMAWILGWLALKGSRSSQLSRYHGRLKTQPVQAGLFLLSFMFLAGMPLTPSFIAQDLSLHWAFEHNAFIAVSLAAALTIISIATARIFTRVYFGRKYA